MTQLERLKTSKLMLGPYASKLSLVPIKTEKLKDHIREMKEIHDQIESLKKKKEKLQEIVIKELGIGGIKQFELIRAKVVQQRWRPVPWKDLTYALAKKLYPSKEQIKAWLRGIVRKYPKKPKSPYVLLTPVKEEK